jgi:hypothetical protein
MNYDKNIYLEIIKICFCIFLLILVNQMHILQFVLQINPSPSYYVRVGRGPPSRAAHCQRPSQVVSEYDTSATVATSNKVLVERGRAIVHCRYHEPRWRHRRLHNIFQYYDISHGQKW